MDELIFGLANLSVLLGGAGVALRMRLGSTLDTVLAGATVALAQVVVALLFAGAVLHRLDKATVLVTSLGLGLGLALLGRRELVSAMRATQGRWRHLPDARAHPFEAALLALAGAVLLWRLVLAYTLPAFGYDALNYHLPNVVTWLQSERIGLSPLNSCCAEYPANGALLFTWPAVLLGDDTVVDAVQVGFAILGALAAAGLARSSGLTPWAATAAGALFVLMPIVLAQANTSYVDLIFASTLLVAVFFAVRFFEDGGRRLTLLVLAGLAAGLCLGTKPNGPLSVGLLAAVVLGQLIVSATRGRMSGSRLLATSLSFVAAALALGGFWYVRNAIHFGNPLYPFEVEALGFEAFAGPVTLSDHVIAGPESVRYPWILSAIASWLHDLPFWHHRAYLFDQRLGGLGLQWVLLGAILLGAYAVATWRRWRVVFLTFLVPITVGFLVGPHIWWSRFSIALGAAGAVATAYFLAAWRTTRHGRLLQLATLALVTISAVVATKNVGPGSGGRVLDATGVVRLVADDAERRTFGKVFSRNYAWIDLVPAHARVGMARSLFVSPVAGPRFERRVMLLPRGGADEVTEFLCSREIGYLFVHRNDHYDAWAQSRSQAFRPVFLSRRVAVYRVERAGLGATSCGSDGESR